MWFNVALLVGVLLTGVLTFAYWHVRNKLSFWARRGVAFSKPHWLFGNFEDHIKAKIPMAQLLVNIYNEFKSERFCGVWRFLSPTLFAIDPELIGHIMVKDSNTWSSRGLPFDPDHDPLSETLVHLNDKKWKSIRGKLSPTFTPKKLKEMYHLLLECGNDFEKYLNNLAATGGLVEAHEMSARFLIDVNGSWALGIKVNSFTRENTFYQKFGKEMFERMRQKNTTALLRVFCPWLFKLLRLRLHTQEITDFFVNTVKQSFEYREENNIQRNDFVDLLRSLKNTGKPLGEGEVEFDDQLLAAQAFDFFLGVFESSTGALSYCLHELAVNEDIQDRVREEIHLTKAADNGEITWDGLSSMKYLDMVVQETFRKYPVTVTLVRMSAQPYRIPDTDVVLPSGTMCFIPIYALHHDPDYYPDPEKFDPERFTPEAKSQRPAFTFLPFGAGPRNCIAPRFGEYEIKVALVKLLDNFRVSLREKSEVPLELDPTYLRLVPKNGIWLRISKISST